MKNFREPLVEDWYTPISKFDWVELEDLKNKKLVRFHNHPTREDLIGVKYTDKCVYEKAWSPITVQCRGIVLNSIGEVVARPFPKFFNVGELPGVGLKLPDITVDAELSEKIDGSLLIVFWNDEWIVTTTGSFTSEQSIKGKRLLEWSNALWGLDKRYTHMFEVVYPENRIVLDYGKGEHLYYLGSIRTEFGYYYDDPGIVFGKNIRSPNKYTVKNKELLHDIEKSSEIFKEEFAVDYVNREGFVIKYDTGFRAKLKFPSYVTLHASISDFSKKRIWEKIKSGSFHGELLSNTDAVYKMLSDWISKELGLSEELEALGLEWAEEILNEYGSLSRASHEAYDKITNLINRSGLSGSRKEFALEINKDTCINKSMRGLMFLILDKNYEGFFNTLLDHIKPKSSTNAF